ncbi:phosphoenolpyruvate carboxykinase (ATP) [Candidatus Uhrbacteria bacterium]|nr:phosphoenolpyruvate carboxykinase (ATP) [Candidatus Uhrbacteria bacterium]
MNSIQEKIQQVFASHKNIFLEIDRANLIQHSLANREVILTGSGALARWTPLTSTGRSPQDTYIVRHAQSEHAVDWSSPNNNAMAPEVFDGLLAEALESLGTSEHIYTINRVLGACNLYALPIEVITTHAFSALFADTMFRAVPDDISKSIFANEGFQLLVLPFTQIDGAKYADALRRRDGKISRMGIAMDMDRRICLVIGSQYCGAIKKTMFTVMNYLLPAKGILPIHSSATIDEKNNTSLMLGLSGTGKTTLSNDPRRLCIGDDEHGWSEEGIANFENGCYAKLIHLDKEKEPEIYGALFDKRPINQNGCIIENAMVYPDGSLDLDDDRFTENSRGSFPLSFLSRKKEDGCGGHPSTILFLTADAHGVLPSIAKLTKEQALFWFLMGYTCKLAGTETGITAPVSIFSRFFGQPFMPRQPMDYISLFEKYLDVYKSRVYLVNTGWSGGPYGVGTRMNISLTRALVDAALSGELEKSEYRTDPLFKILVPLAASGVDSGVLDPRATWPDKEGYDERAKQLAKDFQEHFQKSFEHSITDERIRAACPAGF